MVSLFNALNISSNALTVNESAISVVSHNVANMNTEGYSKQKVNLATRNIAGAIGNNVEAQIRANGGVMIANVMRYNDSYLNGYYRDQLSKLNEYEQQLGNLGDLAEVFDDLEGEGIDAALADFYKAVNNLNEYPASSTARVNFIESAKTLTSVLNSKSIQLSELTSQALGDGSSQEALENSKIYTQIMSFNNKLEELAEVNNALCRTQTGTLQANNLLDKRDMILNDISEFVEITVEERDNGSVTIYSGNTALVRGSVVTGALEVQTAEAYCKEIGLAYPDGWIVRDKYNQPILDENGKVQPREAAVISIVKHTENGKEIVLADANGEIKGGALGGLLHSADLEADGMNAGKAQAALNNLAQAIANVFNDLNTGDGAYSINPKNTSQLVATNKQNYIFVGTDGDGTGVTAGNITINEKLLTDEGIWDIACAFFKKDENVDLNAVGNAQNAAAMLLTRGQKPEEGTDNYTLLNGMAIEDYYTGLVGKVAAGGNNMQTLFDTQSEVVDSIYNEITGNNSVDLNEELVDLVKYQTAYAASAQVFNTCNSCLDTLMSLGR
jgi:flagellar hook-associated protein 1 FlgK